jgi:Flp pilus assembly protein TadG
MHQETRIRPCIHDRGSVVVEAALVIPVLLVVTVLLVWVTSLGATYVRVLDVAQTAARQTARGMHHVATPEGIAVTVGTRDGLIHAVASEQVAPPLAAFTGWSVTVRAEAHAVPEWISDVPDPLAAGPRS